MRVKLSVTRRCRFYSGYSTPWREWAVLVVACLLMASGCGGSGKSPAPRNAAATLAFVTSSATLDVREGETGSVRVKLSKAPATTISGTLQRISGDADVAATQSGTFTVSPTTWNQFQSFEFSARTDADSVDGVAIFRFAAPGVAPFDMAVRELDNASAASALIATESSWVTVSEGGQATLRVRLARAPGQRVSVSANLNAALRDVAAISPGTLLFDDNNWSDYQTVGITAASDADRCNRNGEMLLEAPGARSLAVALTIIDAQRPASVRAVLCGELQTADGSSVDSDVNDANARYVSNDTSAQAQAVLNPATIAGYVNAPGSGMPGRSMSIGDSVDVYNAQLKAGDRITLHIASWQQADLDLMLYDQSGTLVNAAVTGTDMEQLVVPGDGIFFVRVQACVDAATCARRGASNYVLVVGGGYHPPITAGLQLTDAFVAGEIIAAWSESAARALVSTAAVSGLPQWRIAHGAPSSGALLTDDAPTALRAISAAAARDDTSRKLATLFAVKRLRDQGVRFAEPNLVVRPMATPNDPLFSLQWHATMINAPQAWDVTPGSDQVVVAVVDTGVLLAHPDLQGKMVGGYDFIRNVTSAGDGDGIDANPDDPGDQAPQGSSFHGTHVTGTIAAASNNRIGVAGIGGATRVMPLRVLGRSDGDVYDVQQAILYAARLPNDSGTLPPRKADVINMSLGTNVFSQSLFDVIKRARAAGVILVAAAGNHAADAAGDVPIYPAAYDGVVSVSAVDSAQQRTNYANFGPQLDVMAPGGDSAVDRNGDGVGDGVVSTGGSDTTGVIQFRYPVFQGTSMAAPHVSGTVALMRAVFPGLTPDGFDALLQSGVITRELGAPGRDDQFGYGLIDASKAVVAAAALVGGGGAPLVPRLAVQPAGITFNTGATSATLLVTNAGGGSLVIQSVRSDQPWLDVRANVVDGSGIGSYRVDATPSVASGVYRALITVVSSAGEVVVPVVLTVNSAPVQPDGSVDYVLLYDAATRRVLQKVATERTADGKRSFQFVDIAPGAYQILAGTDINQDGQVCDPGELCGLYGSVAQPNVVIIEGADIGALELATTVTLSISAASSTPPSILGAAR